LTSYVKLEKVNIFENRNRKKGVLMDPQNTRANTLARTRIIAGISLILGILFDYFFYDKIPGISFPLYVILIIAGLFIITKLDKGKINKEVFFLLVLLIFFSTMVFVRSSGLLTFLNIIATLILLLIITQISFGYKIKNFAFKDYIKIFFLPFKFIPSSFQTLSSLFSQQETKEERKVFPQIVQGILMAIPVLFVFLLLFSSADLIFQKVVTNFFNIDNTLEVFLRFILILIVTVIFVGAYAYSFRAKSSQTSKQQNIKNYTIGKIENSILLGSVNFLFFVFILVQFTYLFGGESNISAQGFTYAEYARRGFFELIAVAIISLLLLLVIEKYVIKEKTGHVLGFKILSTALVIQVMLIMVSAFTRLSLYEQAYGFTVLRFYSHAFIILLAIIFCLLLYKIHQDRQENTFALRAFSVIILFIVVMNFLNPDAFIARRNIERFEVTGKLDLSYLSQLSDDAVPVIIELLNISNEEIRKSVAHELYWHAQENDSLYFSKWQSFNLSQMRANKILNSEIQELEPYKDYQQQTFNSQ